MIFCVKLSINNHIVGLVHKNHIMRTRLMHHAACKVEFQPFKRVYSQLTFSTFYKNKSKRHKPREETTHVVDVSPLWWKNIPCTNSGNMQGGDSTRGSPLFWWKFVGGFFLAVTAVTKPNVCVLVCFIIPVTMGTRCFHKKLAFQRYPPKDFCTARYEHKFRKKGFKLFKKQNKK